MTAEVEREPTPLEEAFCEGCRRWRLFPWPAVRVSRLCPECLRLAQRVQEGEEVAKALVRGARALWGLRVRLWRWLRPGAKP